MRVDVLISGQRARTATRSLGTLTKTLLQNIEVLSAGQDFKKDAEGKPVAVQVVNLLVTPEQAEKLSLAASQTTIQLVLRNPLDHDIAKTPGTALAASVRRRKVQAARADDRMAAAPAGGARRAGSGQAGSAEAPPAQKEAPFVMEIISGNQEDRDQIRQSGEGK